MSVLERRLQILLDDARYQRLAAEAASSGRSIAAVIREALDEHFADDDDAARRAAAAALLATTHDPEPTPGEDPDRLKAALDADRERRLAGL